MIEAKDLDAIRKVCAELEALGYTKPRVSMTAMTNELKSYITLDFSKCTFQSSEEDISRHPVVPQ